jgi:hypothetical protein
MSVWSIPSLGFTIVFFTDEPPFGVLRRRAYAFLGWGFWFGVSTIVRQFKVNFNIV